MFKKNVIIGFLSLSSLSLLFFSSILYAQIRPQIIDFKVTVNGVTNSRAAIISGATVTFSTRIGGVGVATGAIFRCTTTLNDGQAANGQVIVSIGGVEYCGPRRGDGPFNAPAVPSATISLANGVTTSRVVKIEVALTDSEGITQLEPYPNVTITVNPSP